MPQITTRRLNYNYPLINGGVLTFSQGFVVDARLSHFAAGFVLAQQL